MTAMDMKELLSLSVVVCAFHACLSAKATTISTCSSGTCFTFINTTLNFLDATSLCTSRREEVLFIEDPIAQNNSLHLLGRLPGQQPVWLNMKNKQLSTWKYVNTEEEYVDDIEGSEGDCVYIQIGEEGMPSKPFAANCQTKKHFICRSRSNRQECKDCFIYNTTEEVSWFTARKLCQDGRSDLDLAFWSKMDFSKSPGLSKLNYGGHFWIGLRKSDWLWQHGDPVKYNNFSGRYPIPGTDCGLLLSDGTWATSHCGDRFGVVCRTPKQNRRISIFQGTQSTSLSTSSSTSSLVTSSVTMTSRTTPTVTSQTPSQITPQFHKGKDSTATVVLAGTLSACFLIIFLFTFIAFWCLRSRSTKCMKAGNATIEQPPPEFPLEFANPSFRENRHSSQIPESNYIYFGGPSCQYDVIYSEVTKDDVTNSGASTSQE